MTSSPRILRSSLVAACIFALAMPAASAGRISAGSYNGYAVDSSGAVWVWGANLYGQLCDGTTTHRGVPGPLPNLSGVATVSAGGSHGLAQKANGSAAAWGLNSTDSSGRGGGQLGDGSLVNKGTPVAVTDIAGAWQVVAGQYHSLAVMGDTSVRAWGFNNTSQLGDGSVTTRTTPITVPGLSGVIAVAAGCQHSLALKLDGTVWAWGYNSTGQLGDASNKDKSTPVAVSGLSNVAAIAAGCAHSLALKNDGTVWAWGFNADGELGGATASFISSKPVQITALSGVSAIAAGNYFSLALKADGTVWSWGKNDLGQLGDGSTTNRSLPMQVAIPASTDVSAGQDFALALNASGTLSAWGNNNYGQLGIGTTSGSSTVPVTVKDVTGANLQVGAETSAEIDRIFDFAQAQYAQFFNAKAASSSAYGYRLRGYPSGVIIAARDGRLYVLGGPFGGLLDVGATANYLKLAKQAGF